MLKTLTIGAGQGGGKIAVAFHDGLVLAINSTASDALPDLPADQKFYFSQSGAGQNASVGQNLFAQGYDLIEQQIFSKIKEYEKLDLAFVSASLGGGTGSGTIGHIADMIKSQFPNVPVIGVFTLPENSFLNPNSASNVLVALEIVRETGSLDSVIFLDNNRIFAKEAPLDRMNRVIWGPIQGALKYVGKASTVRTVDKNDFELMVKGMGGSLAIYETNLPLTVNSVDEIMAAVKVSWGNGYYPLEINQSLNKVGGLGIMMAVPNLQKEKLFHNLVSAYSSSVLQKTVKVNGFFVDPSIPSRQFRVYTILSGLPYPEKRLMEIKEIATVRKEIVEQPDLVDDETASSVAANLGMVKPKKRESRLASMLAETAETTDTPEVQEPRTPLIKRKTVKI